MSLVGRTVFPFFLFIFAVSWANGSDDIHNQKNLMKDVVSSIPGWCSSEKAELLFSLVIENDCQICADIGAFYGASVFPVAKAMQFKKSGVIYAIDAWHPGVATDGLANDDPNYIWWVGLDYNTIYNQFIKMLEAHRVKKYCTVIRKESKLAANGFKNRTIDLIHFDGNHFGNHPLQDVKAYLEKIRDGGFILLNDIHWTSVKEALIYLLERADLVTDFSRETDFVVFKRNIKREQKVYGLFK